LPSDRSDGLDTAGDRLEAAQRSNARRLGALLVLVIVAIVLLVFAWKLGWFDFPA
jgi:hypothetical protein